MRILQVIPSVHPCYGGTSEVFLQICRALTSLGAIVEVATTNASGSSQEPIPEPFRGEIPTHVFNKSFSEGWKYSWSFKAWLKKNARFYDLVHGHSVWSYLPSAASAVCHNSQVPFFLSPHGMLSPYTFSRKPGLKKVFWELSEKKMVQNTKGFFASSHAEENEILQLRSDARILVLPHGLPGEAISVPSQPKFLRETYGVPTDIPILLFFSRLHPKKGLHDLLLPAISQMTQPVRLFIAGGEDPHCPGFENQLKDQVKLLGLSGSVNFLGHIDSKDKWKYFDSADLLVLPSFAENFGMVVVESMVRGTPVIISDQVQAANIVKNHNGGLVIPRDVNVWTSVLEGALTENPLPRPTYGLTWNSVGEEMLKFYSSFQS